MAVPMKKQDHTHSICLFGAAPDTGNQGVTALCQSAVLALHERGMGPITVFDHGRGIRPQHWQLGEQSVAVMAQGAVNGRRIYRPENLRQAKFAQSLGGLGNPLLKTIRQSAAVLDVSGGDSFSDIYGPSRFETVTLPKNLALKERRPLILLPQTYGPYAAPAARHEAARILNASTLAYARDARSLEAMKEVLGDNFDPARHRLGVDMAFGLPQTPPAMEKLGSQLKGFLLATRETPLVGLNVSGLLFNRADWAKETFRLQIDYRIFAAELLAKFLSETTANILLLPHVHQPIGNFESDLAAALALRDELPRHLQTRVAIPTQPLNATEAKWVIARCDWFAGSRMHATIGALSSGVPAAALAYSGKMQGVFETCGQGASVLDLREDYSHAALIERLLGLFAECRQTARSLKPQSDRVRGLAARQMDEITQFITTHASKAEAA
jgi:colanic acid/amylovoran biosynthesis protein